MGSPEGVPNEGGVSNLGWEYLVRLRAKLTAKSRAPGMEPGQLSISASCEVTRER